MQRKTSLLIGSALTALLLVGAGCSQTPVSENDNRTPEPQVDMGKTSAGRETTNPTANQTDSGKTTLTSDTSGTTAGAKTYTMANVQAAATPANCLSAINGKVYDLTKWINQHPGGDRAILSICGKDGSAAFNNKHGGQMRPEKVLAGFEVGVLK